MQVSRFGDHIHRITELYAVCRYVYGNNFSQCPYKLVDKAISAHFQVDIDSSNLAHCDTSVMYQACGSDQVYGIRCPSQEGIVVKMWIVFSALLCSLIVVFLVVRLVRSALAGKPNHGRAYNFSNNNNLQVCQPMLGTY